MATLSATPSETTPSVGDALKKLREARGLSLRQLAVRAHVNVSSLSRWEAGLRTPALPELDAVLAALEAGDAQKCSVLRLMNAPRALVRLRAMDTTGAETIASGGGGDLLWAMRKRRGWTQTETARAVGVSQTQIGSWERGDAWPGTEHLHALCWALGALPDEITALTQSTSPRRRSGLTPPKGFEADNNDNWSQADWTDFVGVLLSDPPTEALASLAFIAVEQRLAQKASRHPFAAALLPDVYAIHARHYWFRNEKKVAVYWAERGLSILRQQRFQTPRAVSHKPLWFGNIMILTSLASESPRPAELRRGATILRDWLPVLRETATTGPEEVRESAIAHHAWGQIVLARPLLSLGLTEEALRLAKEACLCAERLNPGEGYMRWRDYGGLLQSAGQPARALNALARSRAQIRWDWQDSDTVARHSLLEARCLAALNDTAAAEEKARNVEQLIAGKNLGHLRPALRGVTDAL